MGQNFDDNPGFQPKITPPKHFSRQCIVSGKESSKGEMKAYTTLKYKRVEWWCQIAIPLPVSTEKFGRNTHALESFH